MTDAPSQAADDSLSEALADDCRLSAVDEAPRKLERPSDHAPVVAEFDG